MKLFLSWVLPCERFDPNQHVDAQIALFSCTIRQRESEVAMARFSTDSSMYRVYGDVSHMDGVIAYDDGNQIHVLFRGRMLSVSERDADGLYHVELNAEPRDSVQRVDALVAKLSQDPLFEPGFYDRVVLADVLESRSDVMHWDRVTHQLCLSSIAAQINSDDALYRVITADSMFHDSFHIRMGTTPVNAVHVTVEALWEQSYRDVINIGPLIARQFKRGIMNTLTARVLENMWPKTGDKIGPSKTRRHTGYTVVKSTLTRLPEGERQLPMATPPLMMCDRYGVVRERMFKRAWYRASLWVNWDYRQRCKESVMFCVRNHVQMAGGLTRNIHFRIPDGERYMTNMSDATVLRGARGRLLLDYVVSVARSHIQGASRHMEIDVCVPFDEWHSITLMHTVRVEHPDLPMGCVHGKVIDYELRIAHDQWIVWVKVGVDMRPLCVHQTVSNHAAPVVVPYVHQDAHFWMMEGRYVDAHTHGDIEDHDHSVTWGFSKESGDVAPDPSLFRIGDIVESIDVSGDGDAQILVLQKAQDPVRANYADVLRPCAFGLRIRFKNLSTKGLCASSWRAHALH